MFFNLYYAIIFPLIFSQLDLIDNFLNPIEVAKNITLDYYTGRWYQAATSRSTALLGTGPNFTDVTADYYCIEDCLYNNISVYNQGFDGEGVYKNISGYSYLEEGEEESAKRKLKFYSLPIEGNYWIVKLGPVIDFQYQYSIVTGPISKYFGTRFSLYVLSRNITEYIDNYEEEVKEWCKNNGFIYNWNEYIPTY
jgi:apolipoprotein D and lipocalin family protein